MKLISKNEILLETLSNNGINFTISPIIPQLDEIDEIAHYHYHFEEDHFALTLKNENFKPLYGLKSPKRYYPINSLQYTSLNQDFSFDKDGFFASINTIFSDPLQQNSASIFLATYQNNYNIATFSYNNSAYLLNFGASISMLFNQTSQNLLQNRNNGYSLYSKYPFLASGYWRGNLLAKHSRPFDSLYKKPFTLAVNFQNKKQFFLSKYANLLHSFSFSVSNDRQSTIGGVNYSFMHELDYESYIGIKAKYLNASIANNSIEEGIELRNDWNRAYAPYTTLSIPTLNENTFTTQASMIEASFYKVFNGFIYSSWSPISIHRESLYTKQRVYNFTLKNKNVNFIESVIGVDVDLLIFNELSVPIIFEWIHNPKVTKRNIFRVGLNLNF
jgi:hypothetical protein